MLRAPLSLLLTLAAPALGGPMAAVPSVAAAQAGAARAGAPTQGVEAAPAPRPARAPAVELDAAQRRRERLRAVAKILAQAPPQTLQRYASAGFGAFNPASVTTQQVALSNSTTAWITSMSVAAEPDALLTPGIGGYDLILRLFVPATGLDEIFSLFVPDSGFGVERPLLVGFHGAGVSNLDLFFSTSFYQECEQRDWFMVAPFQFSAAGDSQTH
ncbi:MAG: hypothetical protein AAFP86_10995, partial [Planctomycetota bacterium]